MALFLAAPHRHSSLVVAADPSLLTQALILERTEVCVVRDLDWHLCPLTDQQRPEETERRGPGLTVTSRGQVFN